MKSILSKYYLKIAIFSSVAISVLGGMNIILDPRNSNNFFFFTILRIFMLCIINWTILFYVNHFVKKIHLSGKHSTKTIILTYYIVGIPIMGFVIYIINSVHPITAPINYGSSSIYRKIFLSFMLCSIILLIKYMFELLDEKQKIRIENERLLRENLQARFEMLRQQVNPHFLFNSLATLKTMMYSDIGKAEEFIIHLSDIFRYSLKTSSDEKVLLREELSILEAYIFMLKCRFEQKLIVKINIDKKYNDFYIPPFTLQIIVENCVKHNIISNKAPLKIDIFSNEAAQLTISNSLQPKNSVETSTHVGLANIDKRYQYLCNEHIEINRENQLFKVIIPLIPNK